MPSYTTIETTSCCDDPDYEHAGFWNEGEYAYGYRECQSCGQEVRDVFSFNRIEALSEGEWVKSYRGACCDDSQYGAGGLERDEDDRKYLHAYTECGNCGSRYRDVFTLARTEKKDSPL